MNIVLLGGTNCNCKANIYSVHALKQPDRPSRSKVQELFLWEKLKQKYEVRILVRTCFEVRFHAKAKICMKLKPPITNPWPTNRHRLLIINSSHLVSAELNNPHTRYRHRLSEYRDLIPVACQSLLFTLLNFWTWFPSMFIWFLDLAFGSGVALISLFANHPTFLPVSDHDVVSNFEYVRCVFRESKALPATAGN